MTAQTLAEKLLLKPSTGRVFVINAPRDWAQLIGGLPDDSEVVDESGLPADFVLVFATGADELQGLLQKAIAAVHEDGLLWIAYPRVSVGGHDISRGVVHDQLRANGWRPVTQISMDETWTAIRARPQGRAT